jgi:hypothetical protein
MIIEDTSGGDLATAAVAHLAHATPERFRFASTDLNGYVTKSYADGAPVRQGGHLVAPQGPGLGVQPSLADLGDRDSPSSGGIERSPSCSQNSLEPPFPLADRLDHLLGGDVSQVPIRSGQ